MTNVQPHIEIDFKNKCTKVSLKDRLAVEIKTTVSLSRLALNTVDNELSHLHATFEEKVELLRA